MATKDKTFVNFTAEQAAQYATGRGPSYPDELYQTIAEYHKGEFRLLIDVGTGPGKVLFDFLPWFEQGIGCDTSIQMIEQAKKDAVIRDPAKKSSFVVCGAESCAKALPEGEQGKADVITVAMAAHWLEMPAFYTSASEALRSGGTLAMWTRSSLYCHPATENAAAIQEVMSDFEDNILRPYHTASTLLTRGAYDDLPLPWTIEGFESEFQKDHFVRKDWDRGGVPSTPPLADGTPGPYLQQTEVSLEQLEKGLGTASSVIRWRQAHPEQAYGEEDPVKLTMKRMREASGGKEKLVLTGSLNLLMMRKA